MDFIAYRFDCWPIELKTQPMDLEFEWIDGKANFEKRHEIIDALFGEGDRYYSLGDGSTRIFKKGNDLVLRRYKTKRFYDENEAEENASRQRNRLLVNDKKIEDPLEVVETKKLKAVLESIPEDEANKLPKSEHDAVFAGRIVYHCDGVTILRVQKKRELKGENKDFHRVVYSENYASSMVILVVRDGLQYVFIESVRKAFAPATLSFIIESTLNRLLMVKYNVMVQVKPVRKLADFWRVITDKQQRGIGVKKLHFRFDYPNLPWPDDLLGGRFKALGRDLNAEAEVILKGQHGQPLRINTKTGERNADVNSMGCYSCDRGNSLGVLFTNNTATNFGYRQTGDVHVALSEELRNVQTSHQTNLFSENLSEEIILKAREVRNMNEGCS